MTSRTTPAKKLPYSLITLMINYNFSSLYHILQFLYAEEIRMSRAPSSDDLISDEDRIKIEHLLSLVYDDCASLNLEAGRDRVMRFRNAAKRDNFKIHEYKTEALTLRQAIEDGMGRQHFYHYPKEKADAVHDFDRNWGRILTAFPSAQVDAWGAVDCWALDHNTACVFHCMRVAERGLRALAKERQVKLQKNPLAWAEWQEILSELKKKIDKATSGSRGPIRDQAFEFYKGAMAQFEAFKDVYRNNVMHARGSYDEPKAKSVLLHTQEFMEILSSRIGENKTRKIRWTFK